MNTATLSTTMASLAEAVERLRAAVRTVLGGGAYVGGAIVPPIMPAHAAVTTGAG